MYALRDRRSVFTNDTRHLVYVRVAENPGASIQDVANMLGISHPTAAYHLKILEGNGLVVAMRDGNRTRYFKRSEAMSQEEQRLVVAQRGDRTKRILDLVRQQPFIHRKELARLLSVPRTTVNWHVDRLIQMGLLAERRVGRYCQLFIPPHHEQAHANLAAGKHPRAAPAGGNGDGYPASRPDGSGSGYGNGTAPSPTPPAPAAAAQPSYLPRPYADRDAYRPQGYGAAAAQGAPAPAPASPAPARPPAHAEEPTARWDPLTLRWRLDRRPTAYAAAAEGEWEGSE